MGAQFTPGPWDWWDDGNRVRVTDAAEQHQICEVVLPSNARLIAAAPELYEALAELMDTLRREAPGTSLNNHRFDALGLKANNALAKARGEA
jgi:hypothetical protein